MTVRKRMLSMLWPHSLWESCPTRGTDHMFINTQTLKYNQTAIASHFQASKWHPLCFSHFPLASLMSQWSMTVTPCRRSQPITSQNSLFREHAPPVALDLLRCHITMTFLRCHWAPPFSLLHTRTPADTQCWTCRYEHLNAGNHSAEASSTTCSWETFWNLTKEQYKFVLIDFSSFMTDIGLCVCVFVCVCGCVWSACVQRFGATAPMSTNLKRTYRIWMCSSSLIRLEALCTSSWTVALTLPYLKTNIRFQGEKTVD